jgi:hypothetical protein
LVQEVESHVVLLLGGALVEREEGERRMSVVRLLLGKKDLNTAKLAYLK